LAFSAFGLHPRLVAQAAPSFSGVGREVAAGGDASFR
jgi:hypothetical protein